MVRAIHRLTESEVKSAIASGREAKLPDGGGLRLDIKNGSPSWVFRYVSPGTKRERYQGLGSAKAVSLDDARQLATAARELVAKGLDPIGERARKSDAEPGITPTFEIAAERYITKHETGWKNPKHRQQWRNSLATYAFPKLGHLTVSEITAKQVADTLEPIWMVKRETAARVRGRIEKVLDAAIATGDRADANPAAWNVQRHLLPLQRRKGRVKHHTALPYSQMPLFFRTLLADQSDAALALRFLILTVARYNEAAKARWSEISGDRWTVPATRMKADREHVVPLSPAALACLKEAKRRYGDKGLIFPGQVQGKPLSDAAFSQAADRNSIEACTTHGFRSTFRDWAGDCTDVEREVIEGCLAHSVGDETEQAYRRATALGKRRSLAGVWADYCMSKVD
jgi:integrase